MLLAAGRSAAVGYPVITLGSRIVFGVSVLRVGCRAAFRARVCLARPGADCIPTTATHTESVRA